MEEAGVVKEEGGERERGREGVGSREMGREGKRWRERGRRVRSGDEWVG